MPSYFTEPARRLPVSASCDVLVVGGGIAGVAAAVAAARCDARVILIERLFALGGLATVGNVTVYLPLCDGCGNQVMRGLPEELLKLSIADGFDQVPPCWADPRGAKEDRAGRRFRVNFNPVFFTLELEQLILRAGIELIYDTRLCQVFSQDERIQAAVMENKSGRTAVECRTIVDASGDADVCHLAGEQTTSLATNVRCGWHYYFADGSVRMQKYSEPFSQLGEPMESGGTYAGDDARDVTAQVTESRQAIYAQWQKLRAEHGPAFMPVNVPTFPTHRMTRRLVAAVELQENHDGVDFDDCVGITGDWRKAGPVFRIPFRSLVGSRQKNLITAGRCISADTAWDVTRAIPTCVVTGQAAGVAAAVASARNGGDIHGLGIQVLQAELAGQGVQL